MDDQNDRATFCGALRATLLWRCDLIIYVWRSLGVCNKNGRDQAAIGYTLSVLPALWAFFMTGVELKQLLITLLLVSSDYWLWIGISGLRVKRPSGGYACD